MEYQTPSPLISTRIKDNWFTRPLHDAAESLTTVFVLALVAIALGVWNNISVFGLPLRSTLVASKTGVFENGFLWQLWTSLFVHADASHLLSNLLLFVPLSYFLIGYFGMTLFPVIGLAIGGLTNFLTLRSMPDSSSLLGISGVVFWMGAVWLTLYALLETKESARRRIGKSLVIGAALFLPQGYEQNISYMAHAIGFGLGLLTAATYYIVNRNKFAKSETLEIVLEEPAEWELELAREQHEAALALKNLHVNEQSSFSDSRYNPDLRTCRTC